MFTYSRQPYIDQRLDASLLDLYKIKSSIFLYEDSNSHIKRDFIIEKQIARHFLQYSECLSKPLPFYATQIIEPFLNSKTLANHDKG